MTDNVQRWELYRLEDVSSMSGTGVVAEGIRFSDGSVTYRWTTEPSTQQSADRIEIVRKIHGHGGKTRIRWIDRPPKYILDGSDILGTDDRTGIEADA